LVFRLSRSISRSGANLQSGVLRAVALCALLASFATNATAQSGRNWRSEERVTITSFARVAALARDQRNLYAATTGGLVIYDYVRERWELPSTVEDGYPVLEAPSALAVDPVLNEVWLGTAQGNLWRWRSVPPRWEPVGIALGEPILAIVALSSSADDAIYIQTRTTWLRARRLSFGAQPIATSEVPRAALQQAAANRTGDPSLAAFRARLGVDQHGRRWPITATTTGERAESYWFGTDGGFVFRFDAARIEPAWHWFGAPATGVTAVAVDDSTVWFGSDGRGPRNGVSRTTHDLQRWALHDPVDGAPSRRITSIAATADAVYFASTDGLYRYRSGPGRAWQRFPVEDATTLTAFGSDVVAGTRRGLVLLRGEEQRDLLIGPAVYRAMMLNDTIWAATSRGILLRAGASSDANDWREASGLPVGAYSDVATLGGRVYALRADALFVREESAWRGPVRFAGVVGMRRLHRLIAADSALWIAGERGVARYQPAQEQWLYFLAPQDIPEGPVFDVAVQGSFLWVATPAGALRLQWRSR
jgi:ligand-binding sensor domain-containing protein